MRLGPAETPEELCSNYFSKICHQTPSEQPVATWLAHAAYTTSVLTGVILVQQCDGRSGTHGLPAALALCYAAWVLHVFVGAQGLLEASLI